MLYQINLLKGIFKIFNQNIKKLEWATVTF